MVSEFIIDHGFKSYPLFESPLANGEIGGKGWNLFDLPLALPLAVLNRRALTHNIDWMQRFAATKGVSLAPHGKTSMSPQIFAMQLAAGAWGLSFATLFQAAVGIAAGAKRIIIANQIIAPADFASLDYLLAQNPELKLYFLVDSLAQLQQFIEWRETRPAGSNQKQDRRLGLLVELGVRGKRSGCRTVQQALELARKIAATDGLQLSGIETYEGVVVRGDSASDQSAVGKLNTEIAELVAACDGESLFADAEILITAGGSAVFDLVIPALSQHSLSRPVRGVLRSGCYVTHDHGHYHRLLKQVEAREGLSDSLIPALAVWAMVQSVPEPGLALLTCGRRDISYDLEYPTPQFWVRRGSRHKQPLEPSWKITALNDQHGFLNYPSDGAAPKVGDMIILGISHPCTTFDKWRWLVLAEDDGTISGAVRTVF